MFVCTFGGLNVKCTLLASVLEDSVPSWWCLCAEVKRRAGLKYITRVGFIVVLAGFVPTSPLL